MLICDELFQINDFAVTTLILALEGNNSLTSLNLEGTSLFLQMPFAYSMYICNLTNLIQNRQQNKPGHSCKPFWVSGEISEQHPRVKVGWTATRENGIQARIRIIHPLSISNSNVISLHILHYRVESRIADAICQNPRLTKIGMKFEFKDVLNRWLTSSKI